MRRLMLLRHAKTETDAPTGRDRDRRLDDRGRSDAAEIGGWVARHPPFAECVLVSSATRTQQTWDIAWAAMKHIVPQPHVEKLPELYGADPMQILAAVRSAAGNARRLMVVGHNPGMHELALALVGSGDPAGCKALAGNMPTSGLAVIDFAVDDWDDVAFRRGELVLFVSPKSLKETSGE